MACIGPTFLSYKTTTNILVKNPNFVTFENFVMLSFIKLYAQITGNYNCESIINMRLVRKY